MDKAGNCNYWCSKSGYCGEKNAHKKGVDCRDCKGDILSYVYEHCNMLKIYLIHIWSKVENNKLN